jgi:hypothetical protein
VRGRIALLGTVHDGQAHVCFARPRGPGASMQDACVSAVAVLGGRGGGSREFAHGAGTDAGRLPEALAIASAKVSNDPTGVATPGRAAGSPAGLAPCNRPIPVGPR